MTSAIQGDGAQLQAYLLQAFEDEQAKDTSHGGKMVSQWSAERDHLDKEVRKMMEQANQMMAHAEKLQAKIKKRGFFGKLFGSRKKKKRYKRALRRARAAMANAKAAMGVAKKAQAELTQYIEGMRASTSKLAQSNAEVNQLRTLMGDLKEAGLASDATFAPDAMPPIPAKPMEVKA